MFLGQVVAGISPSIHLFLDKR